MEPVNDSLFGKLRCTLPSIAVRPVAYIGDEIAAICAPALLKRREQRVGTKDLLGLCLVLTFAVVLTALACVFFA